MTMNEYLPLLIILFVSFIASTLTFFSGFGLGTLLLPAFALFVPLEIAIAMTALVHFANNILKVFLVYATIDRKLLLRFGGAALIGSALGALLLRLIDGFGVCYHLTFFDRTHEVSYIGLIVGILMLLFAVVEYIPKLSLKSISLTLGGLISGFFGGLSGHQGALRAAFLSGKVEKKEVFIATAIAVSLLVDVTRISIYSEGLMRNDLPLTLVVGGILAAFMGSFIGKRLFKKTSYAAVKNIVAIGLILMGVSLLLGLI